MKFPDDSYHLRVALNTENCELSDAEMEDIEAALVPLREPVKDFPVADLYITIIFQPRSKDYHVKTSLVLTGRTLFTGDHDELVYPPYERCIGKLVKKVERYKASLRGESEIAKQGKGTHQKLTPSELPEPQRVEDAVAAGDYAEFRRAMHVYEESLRKRIGRWIQRYPEFEAILGERLSIDDIVEETFLTAFDQYEQRPPNLRLSEWLEERIDESVKQLLRHPSAELENISFARTIQEIPIVKP